MTLEIRTLGCLRRLFIILLSLTVTLFSEKMLISTRCTSGFMLNLHKKSWMVSNCAFTFVHKCSNTSNVKHKRNMLHNFEFWILIQIIMHTMPLVLNQSSLHEVMIFILCHQYSIKELVMTRFDLYKEVEFRYSFWDLLLKVSRSRNKIVEP